MGLVSILEWLWDKASEDEVPSFMSHILQIRRNIINVIVILEKGKMSHCILSAICFYLLVYLFSILVHLENLPYSF